MNFVVRLADKLAGKVIGQVDAGACVHDYGCCCNGTTYGFNCYGQCVAMPCNEERNYRGQWCYI